MLVLPMATREVTGRARLTVSRGNYIPVRANLAGHDTQIAPKIDDGRTPPEPVAVIDAVDYEARLEHERMRDHRIMLRVGVLLNVKILLNDSVRVGKKGPLGSDGRTKFLKSMVIVGGDGSNLRVSHRDPRVESGEFQMLVMLLWAIMTAGQCEDERIFALQLAELPHRAGVIGQLVVGENPSRHNIGPHDYSSRFSQNSSVTPAPGWEQYRSTFPRAGLSSGSGLSISNPFVRFRYAVYSDPDSVTTRLPVTLPATAIEDHPGQRNRHRGPVRWRLRSKLEPKLPSLRSEHVDNILRRDC